MTMLERRRRSPRILIAICAYVAVARVAAGGQATGQREATGSVWTYGDESGKPLAVENGKIKLSLPVVSSRTILLRPSEAK
jgi:hypothetical protein